MPAAEIHDDPIAAVATPAGTGAIGLIRVSGRGAVEACERCLAPKAGRLAELPARSAALAALRDQGVPIDQVMVTVFRSPHSYTGEDLVEISCHGGGAVMRRALQAVLRAGARLARPGEFSQRAFLNGKMDLAQAEAVADLIRAQTDAARGAALSQLEGGLSTAVRNVRDGLVEILAHLETGIDHSDDPTVGETFSLQAVDRRLAAHEAELDRLVGSYRYGRLVRDGVRIGIVGRPNVGKSSLLNRLLKSDRAIVTDIPGTTRDTLEEGFDLNGLPAVLIDTAGLRHSGADAVESLGMQRALQAIENADLVLIVLDGSRPLSDDDRRIAAQVNGKPAVAVVNKSDLPPQLSPDQVRAAFPRATPVSVSVLEDRGIDALLQTLHGLASGPALAEKPQSEILVTSERHRGCLVRAADALRRARAQCGPEGLEECAALETREALDALGELIGETPTEDILNAIFAKFCIGK